MASNRIATIVLAAVLVCSVALAQQATQPRVLAVVNGTTITDQQLWWTMEQGWGGHILDDTITGLLVQQEAEKAGLKVTEPEVDAKLALIRAEYSSDQAFGDMLRQAGITLKGFRMQIQRDLLVDKLLARRAGVTDEGLKTYYQAHRADFTTPKRVRLFDIVTLTLEDAYAARERLAAGETFSAVASDLSRDPTAKKGGDRGWLTPDDVLEEKVREVVFSMQLGEISDPVQMPDHCHVFYAREIEPGKTLTFEEARPAMVKVLEDRRAISEELYLSLLKQRARIEVRWTPHAYLSRVYQDLSVIKVMVDGERVSLPRAAQILPSSSLVVPAAAVLGAMGATLEWDADAGILTATRGDSRIRLIVGVNILAAGEREVQMKEAPFIRNGVLMMPPRGAIEALGCGLLWNRPSNTLYVDTHAETETPADMPSPSVEP